MKVPKVEIPRLHVPSLRGRARADLSALLLMAGVVTLTAMLASAVPPVSERLADRSVAAAVTGAGTAGTLTASSQEPETTTRNPRAADLVRQDMALARVDLPRLLASALRAPVGSVTSSELHLLGGGPGRYLRLAYVAGSHGVPRVIWTEGRQPRGTLRGGPTSAPTGSSPWPVQVGLSQAAAEGLGVGAGDRLRAVDTKFREVEVRVSGVFRAQDPDDAAWQGEPGLLRSSGLAANPSRVSVTALVSEESLPDLPLAVPADDLRRRVAFRPLAASLRWRDTASLARAVTRLKASPAVNTEAGTSRAWDSQLDSVLLRAHDEAVTARAEAAVLVLGLLVVAGLVLALTAQVLARRRAAELVVSRERGAGLGSIAGALLVESVLLTAAATASGVAITCLFAGSVAWTWTLPVAAVGILATPVLGVWVAAQATSGRRVPANRAARRRLVLARSLRRVVVEVAVLVAAVAAVLALHQRGVVSARAGASVDVLAVSAPTLAIVVGALALVRTLPVLAGWLRSRLRSSVGVVSYFSVSGAISEAARPLPFLVAALAVAQLTCGAIVASTLYQGQSAGAWRSVGADARLSAEPSPSLVPLAEQVARAPGVKASVAARVADGVLASSGGSAVVGRLVVVDSAAYSRLLSHTPYPAPQLRLLSERHGTRVAALVGGGLGSAPRRLTVTWQDAEVTLAVVGRAPALATTSGPVVVVDAAAFAATGQEAPPGTIWSVGPGAAGALEKVRAEAGAVSPVLDRRAVLAHRREAPLVNGLIRLALVTGGLLIILGVLGSLVAMAEGASRRVALLSRLRTLGLSRRDERPLLIGHLVAPIVLSAAAGLVLGVLCSAVTVPLLDLDLLTGQTSGLTVAVPWWVVVAVVPMTAAGVGVAYRELHE